MPIKPGGIGAPKPGGGTGGDIGFGIIPPNPGGSRCCWACKILGTLAKPWGWRMLGAKPGDGPPGGGPWC